MLYYHIWISDLRGKSKYKRKIFIDNYEKFKEGCDDIERVRMVISEIECIYKIDKSNFEEVKRKYKISKELGVKSVDFMNETYPDLLRNIYDPPIALFYFGDIEKINKRKNISMVGARKCTEYGKRATYEIISKLKEYEVNTISGGAMGIDTEVHSDSIKNGIPTFVILGSGLDHLYPYCNKELYREIIKEGGAIITEFTVNTKPIRYNFPKRNRIISGVSMLLLILEACNKSGTQITCGQALEQGRDVIAVPGSIFSETSSGCNKIIFDGGAPYTGIEDIVELLDLKRDEDKKGEEEQGEKNLILSVISNVPKHIDEIKKDTGIDIRILYGVLFEMQRENLLKCINGNFYLKNWG